MTGAESGPTRDDLAKAVSSLPEAEKLVVSLINYEDTSVEQVTATLGIEPAEVEAIHRRATLRVAEALGVKAAPASDAPAIPVDVEGAEAPVIGRADKGSQRRVQEWVEHHQARLEAELRRWPSLAEFIAGRVQWLSPLRRDLYREFRDNLWVELGLPTPTPQADGFWPRRGPVWDAVAVIPGREERGVLLVEAKSHTAELESGPCRASAESMRTIEAALAQTKEHLGVEPAISWTAAYYQVANRLAHLWYMRVKRGIPTWLATIYFLGDRFESGGVEVAGPGEPAGWAADIELAYSTLGLPREHPLTKYTANLFLPAEPGAVQPVGPASDSSAAGRRLLISAG